MTVSVAFDGTVIDTADAVTGWSLVKVTSGGGTPSIALADAAYEGLNNLTTRSDNKKIYVYYDIGAGNEVDFTSGSTGSGATKAPGEMFYIWVNFLPSPLLNTQAGGGLGVYLESGGNTPGSAQYHLYYFEGRDTYTGGWIRLAVDPNKTPSETVGTAFAPGNVRYFGAFAYNNQGTAKYDNFVWDQCAHGKGLIVTGSSTLGLAEELIADEISNRHGIVTPLNKDGTAAELLGKLTLGDDVGTVASTITDENSKFFAANPTYYETTLKASCPLDIMGINVVGNGTGDTSVIMGQAVGTTQGRNGIALVGNSTYNVSVDRDDGAVETADFFGSSFENLTGTLNFDGVHDMNGQTMSGCGGCSIANGATLKNLTSVLSGQINLNASGALVDALIINNTATASVLATTLSNITGSFTSDTSNHAVEVTTYASSMTWNGVTSGYVAGTAASPVTPTSTGNETLYLNFTSALDVTVNVGTGATVPSIRKGAGFTGDVNVVANQRTVSFTVDPLPSPNYEWRMYTVTALGSLAGSTEVAGAEFETVATKTNVYTYTYAVGTFVAIQIISDDYIEELDYFELEDNNMNRTINLTVDDND